MEKLSEYLETTGVTQSAFAVRLGVSQSTVSKFIAGTKRPGVKLALRIVQETEGFVQIDSMVDPEIAKAFAAKYATPSEEGAAA